MSVEIPEDELELRFSRSGGPGGQNVNTRDTKVEAIFDVVSSPSLDEVQRARALRSLGGRLDGEGRLHVTASDARTQGQNRELAIARLRAIVEGAVKPPPPPRRPRRPTRAMEERRLAGKRARGALKQLRRSIPDD